MKQADCENKVWECRRHVPNEKPEVKALDAFPTKMKKKERLLKLSQESQSDTEKRTKTDVLPKHPPRKF